MESPQNRGNHLARTPLPQKGAVGAGSQGLPTLGKGSSETYRTTWGAGAGEDWLPQLLTTVQNLDSQ